MTVDTPAKTSELLGRVRSILDQQDTWRERCLNLIASENVLSPAARSVLDSDLLHRYAEGHPGVRYYEGTRYVDEVETLATETMQRIFRASYADVRPISGTVANEAVFSRLVPQGAVAIAHNVASGGHISHARIGSLGKRTNRILPWPMTPDGWRIDPEAARDLIARERPPLVVVGRSLFLFPEPVAEIKAICDEVGTRIFFDGAHVLGLICGGEFQDPLREGADVLAGSTHKTFFGPQRGVVLSNNDDEKFTRKMDKGVFPGSSSNHHLFSLPALLVAALEMEQFGAPYAQATIVNAKALAVALHATGLDVAAADLGYTESHQVAVDVGDHGGGKTVSRRLADQDIICNMNLLPGEPAKSALDPRGIRLGVQEMTRYGMGPAEMAEMAEFMHAAITGARDVRPEIKALRERFPDVGYGYQVADLRAAGG
jgi:glycine hydroxymethyltransferase